jgi:D-lactate dehydrogenase
MKAVAYNIKPFEREYLAKANQKKHEITLISNSLGLDTAVYADGKEAVIVYTDENLSADIMSLLGAHGVKFILTRSAVADHIDKQAAATNGIKVINVPLEGLTDSPDIATLTNNRLTANALQQMANETIKSLDELQKGQCSDKTYTCGKNCEGKNKQQLPIQ